MQLYSIYSCGPIIVYKNNDNGVLLQEYDLSEKILNKFRAVTFSFLVCENYLEFCQTCHILGLVDTYRATTVD